MKSIVVVGASLSGLQAAQALRRGEYEDQLILIGDEPHLPYDRPPLSKGFLAGSVEEEKLRLRPAADPEALGIDWRLGVRAVGLDIDTESGGGTVRCDDGTEAAFDGLIVATGARPRTIEAATGLSGVHLLRTLDDARSLKAALEAGPERVVVIGCGFIGAEVAATARERGLEVTIIEAAETPLGRVLDAEAGMAVADLHRSHGVEVRLGVGVSEFGSGTGGLTEVVLDDGTALPTTVAVIGIGVEPNTEWLEGSGLTIENGVIADETCLAAPGVVVAGDVARWPNRRFGGELMRVEQWDNAVEMGGYAARRLLAWGEGADGGEAFQPVPWFWSDQYDRKIQLAGVSGPRTQMAQGSLAEQRFAQLYLDDQDAVVGALCWNRPRQAIMARQLIADGASLDEVAEKLG